MPISHTVWSLDAKKPLETANLNDEKELELLLRDNIEILSKDWLVISNQVKTKAGKFIDILCMDHDGDKARLTFAPWFVKAVESIEKDGAFAEWESFGAVKKVVPSYQAALEMFAGCTSTPTLGLNVNTSEDFRYDYQFYLC